ncbi:hypothetical protein EVAR_19829_1 [Eumeta japonica]|uniref:MADF domain-containing protein n=1 Tax=Eumeta variegata TaxID=151549 RepID=A0A4C1UQS0_EUMVA|nr:hypothetical protein EVAR_19829_1 [Eumeta japonica]
MTAWTRGNIFKLIELYRSHPSLWNPHRSDHKDRDKRERKLEYIAQQMNMPIEEVVRKIRNLRTQLQQEVKKVKEKQCVAPSQLLDKSYRSTWCYYDALQFLNTGDEEETVDVTNRPNTSTRNEKFTFSQQKQYAIKLYKQKKEEELLLKLQKIFNRSKTDNQIFADYVASSFTNLKHEISRSRLRRRIQKAIMEAEAEDAILSHRSNTTES